eukprot:TRINITY_DN2459_c0_g1_i10.p1 TRINITY_DN2459_c0_g1~~TRINITY_DN2459_c0_g1_i10.p1  ORF type:complete len:136 (-),score=15.05 TRINITY_DN2459_c0_g1_i10:249-656(-)
MSKPRFSTQRELSGGHMQRPYGKRESMENRTHYLRRRPKPPLLPSKEATRELSSPKPKTSILLCDDVCEACFRSFQVPFSQIVVFYSQLHTSITENDQIRKCTRTPLLPGKWYESMSVNELLNIGSLPIILYCTS